MVWQACLNVLTIIVWIPRGQFQLGFKDCLEIIVELRYASTEPFFCFHQFLDQLMRVLVVFFRLAWRISKGCLSVTQFIFNKAGKKRSNNGEMRAFTRSLLRLSQNR